MVWGKVVTVAFLWLLFPVSGWAQHAVENPQPNAKVSGIGVLSGWKCTGTNLTALIDDTHTLSIPYGSSRSDTQGVCGDANNGYGLLVNWNLLSDGAHTVKFYDNGVSLLRCQ